MFNVLQILRKNILKIFTNKKRILRSNFSIRIFSNVPLFSEQKILNINKVNDKKGFKASEALRAARILEKELCFMSFSTIFFFGYIGEGSSVSRS